MDYSQKLILKYKNEAIKYEYKQPDELYNLWIKKPFVHAVDFNFDFTESEKDGVLRTILDSDKYRKSGISEDELSFLCFVVDESGDWTEYYKSLRERGYEITRLYVALEKNTECIVSNCSKLFLDVFIDRGIRKKDYDEETIALIEFLSRLEARDNKWY